MSLDAILKVGGSLSRGSDLPALCREIGRLGERHRLIAVPGGGPFADQVREVYRQYHLNETAAHCMALLAMDQFGYLLNQLIPGSSLEADLESAMRTAEAGRVAILLPASLIIRTDPVPNSWDVTSDSIAAWTASQMHCQKLILLKDVDGLWSAGNPSELIAEMNVGELAKHVGGVDRHLANILSAGSLEAWIINGLKPERLGELLDASQTIGTKIAAA